MTIIVGLISLYLVYHDIRHKKVPNIINIILLLLVVAGKFYYHQELLPSLFSGLAAFITFFLIYLFSKGGMGMGDCKYTAIIAFHFGYHFWLQSIIICSITALVISITLLLTKKIDRKTRIPFIPFLVFGWIINYIIQQPL